MKSVDRREEKATLSDKHHGEAPPRDESFRAGYGGGGVLRGCSNWVTSHRSLKEKEL